MSRFLIIHRVSKKIVRYLIFCNLKKSEPMFIIFGDLIILASNSIYNFCIKPHTYLFYFAIFRLSEIE